MIQVHLAPVRLVRRADAHRASFFERVVDHTLCNIALVPNESRTFLESMCDHQAKNTCSACLSQKEDHAIQPVLLLGTGW